MSAEPKWNLAECHTKKAAKIAKSLGVHHATSLFYPRFSSGSVVGPDRERAEAAKEICESCQIKHECLEWSLGKESLGTWGGKDEVQRRSILKAQTN